MQTSQKRRDRYPRKECGRKRKIIRTLQSATKTPPKSAVQRPHVNLLCNGMRITLLSCILPTFPTESTTNCGDAQRTTKQTTHAPSPPPSRTCGGHWHATSTASVQQHHTRRPEPLVPCTSIPPNTISRHLETVRNTHKNQKHGRKRDGGQTIATHIWTHPVRVNTPLQHHLDKRWSLHSGKARNKTTCAVIINTNTTVITILIATPDLTHLP